MDIKKRIKIIEDRLNINTNVSHFFTLIQKEPNSNIYSVRDMYKNIFKDYEIDNIQDFYDKADKKDHILQIDVVDNSHLEQVLWENINK